MPWDIWLIFLVLAVFLPWRGHMRLKVLLANPQVGTTDRLALYASTIAFQWLAVAVVAWRAWARRYSLPELGLDGHLGTRILLACIIGAATLSTLQWFNLRRVGRLSAKLRARFQSLAERLFPQSTIELLPYFALAATAGICEEFLYRGFAMAALTRSGIPHWTVIPISSILFGLAHIYQGRGGFVSTMLVGVVFGIARIAYDSLVPVMVWHVAIDMVAGVAGPRYLLGKPQTASAVEI
jgi:membrane protease YdiL (CAAX protease family)